jgi:hypothetical protein
MNPSIQHNFLSKENFERLQKYCYNTDFKITQVGEKLFSVLQTPEFILEFLEIENHKLILSFIRESYDGFDNQLNIHADNRLEGEKVALASVLYINHLEEVTLNGTAFYKHHIHGTQLPDNCPEEEHNRLLIEDANYYSNWNLEQYIPNIPNSIVTYNGSLFHSKFPANIDKGLRIVLVAFYKKNIK